MNLALASLNHERRELVLEFVCFFSRFEFALKNSGFLKGNEKLAAPDWDKFSDSFSRR